jgi:very-short-patch-repair endonuclease
MRKKIKYIVTEDFRQKQILLDKYKKELKIKITPAEKIFKSKLKQSKIKFREQKGFIRGDTFIIADFFIPKIQTIIEIDGCYHNTEKQKLRDFYKDKFYKSIGLNVIRISNEEVYNYDMTILESNYINRYLKKVYETGTNVDDSFELF